MKRSLRIARVRGVPIQIHWTFPLLFLFFWGLLYLIGAPRIAYVYVAIVTILIFVFVLLHELAHVATARIFGVGTRSVTLFPLGGVSMLERVPERPAHEALVAFAGPLLNIVAALLLIPIVLYHHGIAGITHFRFIDLTDTTWGGSIAEWILTLFWINVVLGAFNLLPAIPLDGGRVMRAGLATRIPYATATRVAAFVGRVFAIAFVMIGLFWNIFLTLIGIFVFFGASTEERSAQLMQLFARLDVAHTMQRDVPTVHPETRHDELVALRDPARPRHIAVVADDATLLGLIPPETLRFLQPQRERSAGEIMVQVPHVRSDDDLGVALRHFAGGQVDAVAVTEAHPDDPRQRRPGRFLGIISTEDMEAAYRHLRRLELEERAARKRQRAARRSASGGGPPAALSARSAREPPADGAEYWVPERPTRRK